MTTLTRENKLTAPTRNSHVAWTATNPVVPEGVLIIVKDRLYVGSVEYAIGDGVSNYNALRKFGEAKDADGKIDLANVVTNSADGLLQLDADGNVPDALANAANKLLKLDANGKAPAERLYITGALAEGAIIESGENTNGRYTKFADGTMICIMVATALASNNSTEGSRLAFPAVFLDSVIGMSGHATAPLSLSITGAYVCEVGAVSESLYFFKVMKTLRDSVLTPAEDTPVRISAIGRWK